ncbi:MAG: NAD(P)/FAD-dependent oxidoreductase [Microcella sp.]|uniref:NAD(P)/FAD-dependent oxidoreductase n=1 Tax=Microcella sp. TaxID=1913979 RepID=UPI0024CCC10A|nr:NAD(P)/FAD-dependent oxidoreductase [Microcella sp.]UYN84412.1 MAG: NAD(P)/FAD-dependent oxidoreductase [Microcella sp.]
MTSASSTPPTPELDVLVIGGGAAGLSGAIMLARSRRRVEVIDSGDPRNAPAAGVHGLLGHDGISPLALLERARGELEGFGGTISRATVVAARPTGATFTVDLDDGGTRTARRLLIATGLRDELPEISGLRERWGRDVIHCPYCHGWEARDQRIGVIATGPFAAHQALLFRQLSDDVLVIAPEPGSVSDDDRRRLDARGIAVFVGEPHEVVVVDDRVRGLSLSNGSTVERDVLVVGAPMRARLDGLDGLGLVVDELPGGFGTVLRVDNLGKTSVAGVRAAGNVADPSAQVGAAAAAGAMAGAQLNAELVELDIESALSIA